MSHAEDMAITCIACPLKPFHSRARGCCYDVLESIGQVLVSKDQDMNGRDRHWSHGQGGGRICEY